ncbi:MAG: metallophosphoesterase family protein [Peptococcaceae bacterium]|jgi:putative phosphoesterase|nr:metallophosphoesterase family protein [Peptococcaceae bacterium]
MKVAILSDTHIRKGQTLPQPVWQALADVNTIIHAGDFISEKLLEDLRIIAPTIAVRGNCDWLLGELPDKAIVQFGELKVGITHGYQGKGSSTPDRAYNTFIEDQVDMIVFGHSHIPYKNYINGVLMFNPGSPTEKRGQPYFSIGLMTIEDDSYDVRHVFF